MSEYLEPRQFPTYQLLVLLTIHHVPGEPTMHIYYRPWLPASASGRAMDSLEETGTRHLSSESGYFDRAIHVLEARGLISLQPCRGLRGHAATVTPLGLVALARAVPLDLLEDGPELGNRIREWYQQRHHTRVRGIAMKETA